MSQAALFDPSWIVDPATGAGLHRADVKPCGTCGGAAFLFVRHTDQAIGQGCYCSSCYRVPGWRLARSGDVVYGTLDARTGAVKRRTGEDDR